jgi:hypothetical protein
LPVDHVAYGLRITTNQALPGLPILSDSQPPDVRVQLKGTSSPPPSSFVKLIYASPIQNDAGASTVRIGRLAGGAYGVAYSDGARFAIECRGREILADWPEDYTIEDACTYLMGPVMGLALRLRGITCLHASAVAVNGYAIALVGGPGAGKSTTAAAFARRGYPVLSDDVVALDDRGDHFLVQPGYPRINIWPDSVRALFGTEEALPRITPTWDKRFVALDEPGNRFQSKPLPLAAVYVLNPCDTQCTPPVIAEFTGPEALMTLIGHTYVSYFLDEDMRRRDFDVLSRALPKIPARVVRYRADFSRPLDLCDTVTRDLRQNLAWPAPYPSVTA